MIRLIDLLKEDINFPTYEEIKAAIQSSSNFKNYGLRVLTTAIPIKDGDKLRDSNQWTWSGEDSGLSLGGVSTIGIFSLDKRSIDRSLKLIQGYNTKDTQLILVGGGLARRGQDAGELIIKDGVAIKIWK